MSLRFLIPILLCVLSGQLYAASYKIGVLAFNGKAQAIERWKPTADYLSERIAGADFSILPMTHEEFLHAINKDELDFILTNPGHYVLLEVKFGVTRIVTFLSRHKDSVLKHFSAVVFARADSGLDELLDLKGRSLAAVSEDAFGGFQLARLELEKAGVDVLSDMDMLWLGFPHADIVNAVKEGRADAGVVRAGILERMAEAGQIDMHDFRVLAPRLDEGYPYLHSTGLFPEWPFAGLPRTNTTLAKKVAVTLLEMEADAPAALKAGGAGWTIPLDYASVHEVLKTLNAEPYPPVPVSTGQFVETYRAWIGAFVAMLLVLSIMLIRLAAANRELTRTRNALQQHRLRLEDTVQERTDDLLQTNEALQIEIASHVEAEKVMQAGCRSLQALHDIFVRADLDRQQKLNSLIDSVRAYVGTEFAMLSTMDDKGEFENCSSSPLNANLPSPLAASLVEQAIDERQIVMRENLADWKRYIASPVFNQGRLCCILEFASSHQFQPEEGAATSPVDAELCLRILNLISHWAGNEITLLTQERAHEATQKRFENLSKRETQVLELLILGDSTKIMARKLSLSTKTVEMHRASLLRKTAARSSTELVQLAVNAGVF